MPTDDSSKGSGAREHFRLMIERDALKRREHGARIVGRSDTELILDDWLFDFRSLAMRPEWINAYAELFWQRFASNYPFQVGGMETGAIPLVSAIVMKGIERGTPVSGFYIRKSRKRDGLMKIIEGDLTKDPVILVDDLINSGRTFDKQIRTLEAEGRSVAEIYVLLAFRPIGQYPFAHDHGTRLRSEFTLTDFGIPLRSGASPEIPQAAFETVWEYRAPNPSHHLVVAKSVPALDEHRLYMGFDDGIFRAFDKLTGMRLWEFATGHHPEGKGILSSPAIADGTVYFGAYDGTVYALHTATGKKRWAYDRADWVGSSPCIDATNKRLFIGLEFGLVRRRGGIVALDLETGETIWEQHVRDFVHATPLHIPEERLVVIGSNGGALYAFNDATGALKWSYATDGDIKSSCAYDKKRRMVLTGSMDGVITALDARDGTPLHVRPTGAGVYGTPVIDGDTLFVASLDKSLYAIDLDTWTDRWQFKTSGRIFATPAIGDDSLWIGSNDGRLYELDATDGGLRAAFQTPEKIVSRAIYDTGYIYVTTHANEIYCLKRISK